MVAPTRKGEQKGSTYDLSKIKKEKEWSGKGSVNQESEVVALKRECDNIRR